MASSKCSRVQCKVPEIFRCDMCGNLSPTHQHCTNITGYGRYVLLVMHEDEYEDVKDFYVCSSQCSDRLTWCLMKCDLTHGLPYRVMAAYDRYQFMGQWPSEKTFECLTCKKLGPLENFVRADMFGDEYMGRRERSFFCRSKTCLLKHVQHEQYVSRRERAEREARGEKLPEYTVDDYMLVWRIHPLGKVGGT